MSPATSALVPLPPFRLDLTVWALRRRASNLVDRWDGRTYRRVLLVECRPVEVAVEQSGPADAPRLEVTVSGDGMETEGLAEVESALERLLGASIDLSGFYRLAERDPNLGPLANRFRGLKPPRYLSLFEALANAIACQQVTLSLGLSLLNRLSERHGVAVTGGDSEPHAFPRPRDLVGLNPKALRELGFSTQKARALVELSARLVEGRLDLTEPAAMDDEAAVAWLRRLRGVGRWTAEYVLLRGLGRLNVLPGDDAGARSNLRRWLGPGVPMDYEGIRQLVAPWQPYAGLVYLHLLLMRLQEAGYL